MRSHKLCVTLTLTLVFSLLLASPLWAQIEIGNAVISGEAELGGLPRDTNGKRQK